MHRMDGQYSVLLCFFYIVVIGVGASPEFLVGVEIQVEYTTLGNFQTNGAVAQSFMNSIFSHIAGVELFIGGQDKYGDGNLFVTLYDNLPITDGRQLGKAVVKNPKPSGYLSVEFPEPIALSNLDATYYLVVDADQLSYTFGFCSGNPYPRGRLYLWPSSPTQVSPVDSFDLTFQTLVILPYISPLGDRIPRIPQGQSWNGTFHVEDLLFVSSLVLTVSSSNESIIRNSSIELYGPSTGYSAVKSLAITPESSQSGEVEIRFYAVNELQDSFERVVQVLVLPATNDILISTLKNQIFSSIETSMGPLWFAVGAFNIADNLINVTASSSNDTIISTQNINIEDCTTDKSGCRIFLHRSLGDARGETLITIRASSEESMAEAIFSVLVADLPEISDIENVLVLEDVTVIGPILFSVAHPIYTGEQIMLYPSSSNTLVISDSDIHLACNNRKTDCNVTIYRNISQPTGQSVISIQATVPNTASSSEVFLVSVAPLANSSSSQLDDLADGESEVDPAVTIGITIGVIVGCLVCLVVVSGVVLLGIYINGKRKGGDFLHSMLED